MNSRPISSFAKLHRRPVLRRADDRQLLGLLVAVIDARLRVAPWRRARRRPSATDGHSRSIARASSIVRFGRRATSRKLLPDAKLSAPHFCTMMVFGPELADRIAERLVEAADERRHADDRRDADDDAEHGQRRAHLVRRAACRATSTTISRRAGPVARSLVLPCYSRLKRFDRIELRARASPDTGRRTGRRPR